jgi:hypothetical protein
MPLLLGAALLPAAVLVLLLLSLSGLLAAAV